MSYYCGFTRTNYFAVKDEDAFRKAVLACGGSEERPKIWEKTLDGRKLFAFGCYGSLYGFPTSDEEDDSEDDLDAFYDALQQVVEDGHAVIITEIGYEKLRYLVGDCTVITPSAITFFNLRDTALAKAQELLNDAGYAPRMEY